ncbi:hypothetical protein ACFO0O_03405 [Cobetia amphilecti]|uniref:Uncharacterized protein n=1 Tax=Cobetia amphilecti TaxID=1055104 RepID=A0ABT6UP90_9GAMM|nr:hypothetical protein [Cobetia amphilecti]MDI5884529.1 hypothetical protein [Cobetia amphilecti]
METTLQALSLTIPLCLVFITYKANPIFNHERLKVEKLKLYEIFANIKDLDSPTSQESLYLESVFQIITGCSEPYIKIRKILTMNERLMFLDNMKKFSGLFYYYENGQFSLIYRNIKKHIIIFTIALYGYLIFGLLVNISLLITGSYSKALVGSKNNNINNNLETTSIIMTAATFFLSIAFLYAASKSQKKLKLMMKLTESESSRYTIIFNSSLSPQRRFISYLCIGNKMMTRKLKRATYKIIRVCGL